MVLERLPAATDLNVSSHRADFTICLEDDLPYFQGHFPYTAILPGVAQIHWAMKWGRQYLDIKKNFVGMEQVKFHMPVKPGDHLCVSLDWDIEKSLLSFRYTLAKHVVSSGRIRMG